MRIARMLLALVLLATMHVISLGKAQKGQKELARGKTTDYVLPPQILKITALEYDGMLSDLLYLRGLVFLGGTFERSEPGRERVQPWEWQWCYNVMDTSSQLDPWFFDPYFTGNAFFTLQAGMVRESNALLERGMRARDWDWMIPFFIGFNHYYFLRDIDRATEYLMEASRRPGPSEQLASLASRLAFKENRTLNSILFLEAIVRKTQDDRMRENYEIRLKTLRAIRSLEIASERFQARFRRKPRELNELVTRGILTAIPDDPLEGGFLIEEDGTISSRNEYLLLPNESRKKR